MADKKFSELITAATVTDSGILAMSQDLNGSLASQKTTVGAVGTHIAKEMNFTADLQTTSKNIIGAINEAATSGGDTVTVTNTITPTTTTKKVADVNINSVANSIYADDAEKVLRQAFSDHTVTGNPITFDAYLGLEVAKSCEVTFSPIQDLHGYDYPWAGGAGKNKLPITATTETINGVTFTVNTDGSVKINGTATAGTQKNLCGSTSTPYKGLSAGNYILSKGNNDYYQLFVNAYRGTTYVRQLTLVVSNAEVSFTIDYSDYDGIIIGLFVLNNTTVNSIAYPMIRLSTETDATFEPYSNICPISGRDSLHLYQDTEQTETPETNHTATFPETVYGGSYDFVKGVLNVNKIEFEFDGSADESWSLVADGTTSRRFILNTEIAMTNASLSKSNYLVYSSGNSGEWGTYTIASNTYVGVKDKDSNFQSLSDFTNYLSSHPLQIVCDLITPQEITLTEEQIELLKGQNVLFTDGDNIALTYNCDIKAYIDSKLAELS